MRINIIARQGVAKLLGEAAARGLEPGEVLDRGGFLLTAERISEIQARVVDDIAELLETTSPHKFTRVNTQVDLQHAQAAYLREMAKELRK